MPETVTLFDRNINAPRDERTSNVRGSDPKHVAFVPEGREPRNVPDGRSVEVIRVHGPVAERMAAASTARVVLAYRAIAEALTADGVPARLAQRWHPTQVQRILA